jgi:AGZA family xanthine/uracil permease-like MFS transporter
MMKEIGEINFKIQDEGIPAFTCIVCVPFTYSITYGIELGFIAYIICKLFSGKAKEITLPVWILSVLFLTHLFIWR